MSDGQTIKVVGGVAPLGYQWEDGALVVNEAEAPLRKLIYELFLKHRRKKTVAKLMNDLGYRTRNGSLFSDTTVDRLLRDTTAKRIRIASGREIRVEPLVSEDLWRQANCFLKSPQAKQSVHLFARFVFCICGGKMHMQTSADKYVCEQCRHKINASDLEEIFTFRIKTLKNLGDESFNCNLAELWGDLSQTEKRLIVEQILYKITIGKTDITIELALAPGSLKTPHLWQQNGKGNESPKAKAGADNQSGLNNPLMNESQAAEFLGISRMTLLRKRNANEIGFFRIGFRVLYSKEKHLIPFLQTCEK
jgi:hypothetical protein